MNVLGRYLLNWVKWLDAGLNVATGGSWNESVSERSAKARNAGRPWGCRLCALLDRVWTNHCDNSLKSTIGDDAIIPDGE